MLQSTYVLTVIMDLVIIKGPQRNEGHEEKSIFHQVHSELPGKQ